MSKSNILYLNLQSEYTKLAENIQSFTGRLLDRVRDGRELDTLLNEKLGSGLSSYDNLARLKLAIQHEEKKVTLLWTGFILVLFMLTV